MAKLIDRRVLAHGRTHEFTGRIFMGVALVLNVQECYDDDGSEFYRAWYEEKRDRSIFGNCDTGYYTTALEAYRAARDGVESCPVDWEMQRIVKENTIWLREQGLLDDYLQVGKE